MKRNDWIIIIIPLILSWLLDRISKEWASELTQSYSFGYLHIMLHHNAGAMLGLFADLPKVLRVVSLSTGGAFLIFTYAVIQYLLPLRSIPLRIGLSFLLGGILGNVTDRIIWGHVVDFIILGNESFSSPAFNIADAIQWVGYGLIVFTLIKEGDVLWPEYNIRRQYWVNKKFQIKYSLVLMAVGLALTIISLVFSYTYLKVTISELIGNNPILMKRFLTPYLITYSLICFAFCVILFALGKIISHRIVGPLYAFEKYVSDVLNGQKKEQLKLRAGDEFKHLEEIAQDIQERFNSLSLKPEAETKSDTESSKVDLKKKEESPL